MRLPTDKIDRAFVLLTLAVAALILLGMPVIADQVPIHFNRDLQPDRYVGKPFGPFVLIGLAIFVYALAVPAVGALHKFGLSFLGGVVKAVHFVLAALLLLANLIVCFWPLLSGA